MTKERRPTCRPISKMRKKFQMSANLQLRLWNTIQLHRIQEPFQEGGGEEGRFHLILLWTFYKPQKIIESSRRECSPSLEDTRSVFRSFWGSENEAKGACFPSLGKPLASSSLTSFALSLTSFAFSLMVSSIAFVVKKWLGKLEAHSSLGNSVASLLWNVRIEFTALLSNP